MQRKMMMAGVVGLLMLCGLAAAQELQTLQAGEVTISYPAGCEQAAQELATLATGDFVPIRDKMQKLNEVMGDTDGVTQRIVTMLGCPEYAASCREIYVLFQPMFDVNTAMQHQWRIVQAKELRAAHGLSFPPMRLTENPQTHALGFSFGFSSQNDDPDIGKKAFLPFVLNDDGSFYLEGKGDPILLNYIKNVIEMACRMQLSVLHESAEAVLVKDCGCYHPFARWFNDGVANYVMWRVTAQIAPELEQMIHDGIFPEPGDPRRLMVNLLTWTQKAYQPAASTGSVADAYYYDYATELISRLLDRQPTTALADVVKQLKTRPDDANTRTICDAFTQVTGKDAMALLLGYVPKTVQEGIRAQRAPRLYADAKAAAKRKKYDRVVSLLQEALTMDPENQDSRFNLAWAMRKHGAPKEESERQISLLSALLTAESNLHPFVTESAESYYLIGRLLQQQNHPAAAQSAYRNALALDRKHADAQAALKEMNVQP